MKLRVLLIALVFGFASTPVRAAVEVSGGAGADGSIVVNTIMRNWIEAKRSMVPAKAKITRPNRQDFYCVHPYNIRNAMERTSAISGELRCFHDPNGSQRGICCDENLQACAAINPQLAPDPVRKQKDKKYERSPSEWVRPPSDDDQWSTPEPH